MAGMPTEKPTICPKCSRQWREHTIDIDANDNLSTTCPGQTFDPRPTDMAELARMVAVELRKRGIHADYDAQVIRLPVPINSVNEYLTSYRMRVVPMFEVAFDNLGPVAIAEEIVRQEAKRAREWAGDK
jgi:hypothetical protein